MNKKPFKDIEQIIKNAAEAYEPAFDEAAWKQMESLLDKDKDRKRPFAFWLWWLLPFLIGAGILSYFILNDSVAKNEITDQKNNQAVAATATSKPVDNLNKTIGLADVINAEQIDQANQATKDKISNTSGVVKNSKSFVIQSDKKNPESVNLLSQKKSLFGKSRVKIRAKIRAAQMTTDDVQTDALSISQNTIAVENKVSDSAKQEEVIVIKVTADKANEKEIEKIIDSIIKKPSPEQRFKDKVYRFYVIATAGMEGSGVKLFSADKITLRAGLAFGYQVTKKLSVQTGFFMSNKKYVAAGSDYKTKPGSYWNIVNINKVEANCRVYEIPLTIRYDFMPGKKLNIFASVGLSSYIMKKEDYNFYYDRYGTPYKADVYYSGNKHLFSVVRLSAGLEKKLSKHFAILVSPAIALPLAGVGEGEMKLYSTEVTIGLKYSFIQRKK